MDDTELLLLAGGGSITLSLLVVLGYLLLCGESAPPSSYDSVAIARAAAGDDGEEEHESEGGERGHGSEERRLRAWLQEEAGIPQARLDALMKTLAENWVDDLESLGSTMDALDARLPAAAYRAIVQALRRADGGEGASNPGGRAGRRGRDEDDARGMRRAVR